MRIPEEQVVTAEVKSWAGLHLLHHQMSSCSQKVRILLREKDLAWTSHSINLATEEHVSAWFLGVNPRGVVPVLVHDGVVHVESNDILEHLDALPSDAAPFFPADDAERAAVRKELEFENSLHMDLRNLTMGFLMPRRLAMKSPATLERWEREGREDPKRALEVKWWRDYAERGTPPDVARASVEAHRRVFEQLEERLETEPWLGGEQLSVLDVSWFITTLRLTHVGYPLERHPRLSAWQARLEARPAFADETRSPAPLRAGLALYRAIRKLRRTTLLDIAPPAG